MFVWRWSLTEHEVNFFIYENHPLALWCHIWIISIPARVSIFLVSWEFRLLQRLEELYCSLEKPPISLKILHQDCLFLCSWFFLSLESFPPLRLVSSVFTKDVSCEVSAVVYRKKSLSHSSMRGSLCRDCPTRKASLWAYWQGAGTRMVPWKHSKSYFHRSINS